MAFGPHWQHAWLVIGSFLAGRPERHGRRRFLLIVSGIAGRWRSTYPGKCNQYGCPLARPVHLDRCVLARSEGQPAAGSAGLFRGPAGGSPGGDRSAFVPGKATFMALVPWLLLLAAGLFAASGPVSAWLRRNRVSVSGAKPSLAPLWIGRGGGVLLYRIFGAGAGFSADVGAGGLRNPEH